MPTDDDDETLGAEVDGAPLLDDDEVGCAELDREVWVDEVT